MPRIAQAISYKGCTVYDDGRVYRNGWLIGQYKTLAAAKAAATRVYKELFYV